MALWADDDEIVCVHPGGTRVVGSAAIRASFEAIFANGGIPVRPEQVHRLAALGSALHHLVERIEVSGEQGPQIGLGDRHQPVPEDGAGLAPGFAPRQPGRWAHEPPVLGGEAPSTLH